MAWSEKHGKHSWRVRYSKDDGTLGSINGFPTKTSADNYADSIESDQRKGTWIDPSAGKITLEEWSVDWLEALDVAANTESQYRCLLKNHILPRWGQVALSDITNSSVTTWAKKTRARGYAEASVSTMTKVLSMMLADAADDHLIPANPIRTRQRGKRRRAKRTERLWATPDHVVRIADQAAALVGPWAAALLITAGWTGARWGELLGLQRHNTHLDDARLVIDPDIGALHEVDGRFSLGSPKTAESARTITLPPFLVELLRSHLASHDHPHVFVTRDDEHPRRSNFSRRAMRPATDGNHHLTDPAIRTQPVKPGLTFHGLRHSHKTWLIEDNIPEIAQARRLGHTLGDEIREIYSHLGPTVEPHLIDTLQQRWTNAITDNPTHHFPPNWLTHTTAHRTLRAVN
ncbi:tyrosine-type recombinase/integrase [Saccharopolyspora sp. HNM0986]|uniref:tyrosine-type recombinase/integrase n=1 Tax=Saccharopolyspora galaxeae TaxID=2781241 RepID=UPI00190C0595|nr:tyrosine-type recombinase/integrase [Saccharopolyspora sp. HNM0986]MBK0870236.1 tyrosine-type recombinase/integrase [Saccharopolyspora sp. HNM0986]